jgi:uncharacterized membrane-anchored protein YhcB (DUF1043 family)
MNDNHKSEIKEESLMKMSLEDKRNALTKMRSSLEESFVQLGQLLDDMKSSKMHAIYGFESFKEFVEDEFSLSGTLVSKLINNYRFFVNKMNMDEHSLVQIGLEKLNQIRPIIKNAGYVEQQDWLQKAEQQKTTELKEEIKEIKAREKERNRDFKDVLTEQFLETMVTFFNCNRKELMFKLALFFQDKNLEEIDTIIKDKQMKLKDEMAAQK